MGLGKICCVHIFTAQDTFTWNKVSVEFSGEVALQLQRDENASSVVHSLQSYKRGGADTTTITSNPRTSLIKPKVRLRFPFAKCALLKDQNRFLFQVNNVKDCRSIRSIVLGKADLEEARAKREAKDKAVATKGKRGRKCKNPAPEEAEAGPSTTKIKAVRKGEVEPAKTEVSWRVPIANMY